MESNLKVKVYYSDTDAYGVAWHGSYLRWMEMGRVNFSDEVGLDLISLQKNNIVLPVVEVNIRYKYSAKLDDELLISTSVDNISQTAITFRQIIRCLKNNNICVDAKAKVVAINNDGILYRRLPEVLANSFLKQGYKEANV